MSAYEIYCRAHPITMKCLSGLLDWREPQLLTGPCSVGDLPQRIKSQGIQRVLVVTDPGLARLGLPDGLLWGLGKANIFAAVYGHTDANPTIRNIEEARQLYIDRGCQAIIVFGGDSPMDCAKIVGLSLAYPRKKLERIRSVQPAILRTSPPQRRASAPRLPWPPS